MSDEMTDLFDGLTYRPGRLEQGWLLESFGEWLDDGTLTDVLFAVRGGKEANVYCCRGGPSTGDALLAAKVYRPRHLRELSNDAIYREGRGLFDDSGHVRKARDQRIARAVQKGTKHGKRVAHASWVMHEHKALELLHAVGAAVPKPIAATTNAVLMAFLGDEDGAAPTLDRVHLTPEEAAPLLEEALRNVELMLTLGRVHGDLSPYNMMLWDGQLTLIDLPQICEVLVNPHGRMLFQRDVKRVCDGFARYGARADAEQAANAIWDRVFDGDVGVPDESVALYATFRL